ncbi:MAG: VOC family protein, partial [Spirochaetaceae bacterium]|nr:VOC family protein [Spirochaetaceae bacterium]
MEIMATLLAVRDMDISKRFYTELLGQKITADLGENVSIGRNRALQSLHTCAEFISEDEKAISFGGKQFEVYLETGDIDGFMKKLDAWGGVRLQHPLREQPWGQWVVRFFDPDRHIIEVGETMQTVVKR